MDKRLISVQKKLKLLRDIDDGEEMNQNKDAPVVWHRIATGFRIADITEKHFDHVIDIMKNFFIPNEVLFQNIQLENDFGSVDFYLNKLICQLKDETSLMVIDESIEKDDEEREYKNKRKTPIKICGVLIMRVIPKLEYGRVFSRVDLTQGSAMKMKQCVNMRARICKKVDLYAKYNCDSLLRFYDLCVLPEYRHKGLGTLLLKCGFQSARSLDIPIVMGLFTNSSLQKKAKDIGFEILHEVKYKEWKDQEGEHIFSKSGVKNDAYALMTCLVPKCLPIPTARPLASATPQSKKGKDNKKEKGKKK